MPNRVISTIIKLAVLSLLVGLALKFLDLTPEQLLRNMGETAQKAFHMAVDVLGWAAEPVLLGAGVVIPIWLVVMLVRSLRNRSGR